MWSSMKAEYRMMIPLRPGRRTRFVLRECVQPVDGGHELDWVCPAISYFGQSALPRQEMSILASSSFTTTWAGERTVLRARRFFTYYKAGASLLLLPHDAEYHWSTADVRFSFTSARRNRRWLRRTASFAAAWGKVFCARHSLPNPANAMASCLCIVPDALAK